MKAIVLVGLGGALGAITRYLMGGWITQQATDWKFPAGTFAVNVLGCLVAGVLAGLSEKFQLLTEETRLFLFTGVLGGFTTFSAFGLETVSLLRRGEAIVAFWYVGLSVVCGVLMLWLGIRVVLVGAR